MKLTGQTNCLRSISFPARHRMSGSSWGSVCRRCAGGWRQPPTACSSGASPQTRALTLTITPTQATTDTTPTSEPKRRLRRMGRRNALLWVPSLSLIMLGRAIRAEREQRHVSADELAHKAGLDARLFSAVEADPPYLLLMAVADALGVPSSTLVARVEALEADQEAQ
jgi:hypothetical protein